MRKALKTILVIFIFIFIISFFTVKILNSEEKVEKNVKVENFLEKNHSALDLEDNDDFSSFQLLDNDLKDKEIFFTAENHGIKANSELELKFLKYFKEKADISYYLMELSYSDSCFLNQYLKTGDESILEEMYKPLKGTFAWNKQGYEHWKKVYEYNKTLPDDKKIKIIGIDIEHQSVNALRYMNSVLPNKKVPDEIKSNIEEFNKIINSGYLNENRADDRLYKFCSELKNSMKKNKNVYEEYLEDNFFGFQLVNENIINRMDIVSSEEEFNKIRDEKIYENFIKVYDYLPKGKYYGQWGLNHAFQRKHEGVFWLAAHMNRSDSPVKGKVLSIIYLYKNCMYMNRGDYSKEHIYSYKSADFNKYFMKPITLFKLKGENSPFENSLIWPMNPYYTGQVAKDGVTTDYFQYIVVVVNSIPTEPLDK